MVSFAVDGSSVTGTVVGVRAWVSQLPLRQVGSDVDPTAEQKATRMLPVGSKFVAVR